MKSRESRPRLLERDGEVRIAHRHPRISIVSYGQSGSYLSQVVLSGSAVDLLAEWFRGDRLRLAWGSPGGCMKNRVSWCFSTVTATELAREERT